LKEKYSMGAMSGVHHRSHGKKNKRRGRRQLNSSERARGVAGRVAVAVISGRATEVLSRAENVTGVDTFGGTSAILTARATSRITINHDTIVSVFATSSTTATSLTRRATRVSFATGGAGWAAPIVIAIVAGVAATAGVIATVAADWATHSR